MYKHNGAKAHDGRACDLRETNAVPQFFSARKMTAMAAIHAGPGVVVQSFDQGLFIEAEATSASEALDSRPDVIVLDHLMTAGRGGEQAARTLAQSAKRALRRLRRQRTPHRGDCRRHHPTTRGEGNVASDVASAPWA